MIIVVPLNSSYSVIPFYHWNQHFCPLNEITFPRIAAPFHIHISQSPELKGAALQFLALYDLVSLPF